MPATGSRIRFGTSGWRGVLGEDFTAAGVRAVALALVQEIGARGDRPRVVVAHDRRFLADRMAAVAARVLAGAGLRPVCDARALPTPVVTHAVRRRRAAAGLILTASHNPPEYLGVKVVAPFGGGAPRAMTDALERRTAAILAGPPPAEAPLRGRPADLIGPYLADVSARLDHRVLRRHRLRIVYDALYGAGAGVLDRLLRELGLEVELRHGEWDPTFGGAAPDPTPERLAPLAKLLRARRGLWLGIASDGDADRFGVVDASGRRLSETDALALLVDHLARSGRIAKGVALSVATGSLVERVAAAHGLPVLRAPIGFKHLTQALVAGRADVAGEESGGFAWAPLARDKDGILAAALLAEIVAGDGAPLAARLRELRRRYGPSACGRVAVTRGPDDGARLAALGRWTPRRFDGARVVDVGREDGLRLGLEDGFVLWRASGTEPVLRIYAEATDQRRLVRRLRAAAACLRRAR